MARVNYCCLCHGYAIDQISNRVSLFNLVEQLALPANLLSLNQEKASGAPEENSWIAVQLDLSIIAHFSRSVVNEAELVDARLRFLNDEGQYSSEIVNITVDLRENIHCRSLTAISAMPLFFKLGEQYQYIVVEIFQNEEWFEAFVIPTVVRFNEDQ